MFWCILLCVAVSCQGSNYFGCGDDCRPCRGSCPLDVGQYETLEECQAAECSTGFGFLSPPLVAPPTADPRYFGCGEECEPCRGVCPLDVAQFGSLDECQASSCTPVSQLAQLPLDLSGGRSKRRSQPIIAPPPPPEEPLPPKPEEPMVTACQDPNEIRVACEIGCPCDRVKDSPEFMCGALCTDPVPGQTGPDSLPCFCKEGFVRDFVTKECVARDACGVEGSGPYKKVTKTVDAQQGRSYFCQGRQCGGSCSIELNECPLDIGLYETRDECDRECAAGGLDVTNPLIGPPPPPPPPASEKHFCAGECQPCLGGSECPLDVAVYDTLEGCTKECVPGGSGFISPLIGPPPPPLPELFFCAGTCQPCLGGECPLDVAVFNSSALCEQKCVPGGFGPNPLIGPPPVLILPPEEKPMPPPPDAKRRGYSG